MNTILFESLVSLSSFAFRFGQIGAVFFTVYEKFFRRALAIYSEFSIRAEIGSDVTSQKKTIT